MTRKCIAETKIQNAIHESILLNGRAVDVNAASRPEFHRVVKIEGGRRVRGSKSTYTGIKSGKFWEVRLVEEDRTT